MFICFALLYGSADSWKVALVVVPLAGAHRVQFFFLGRPTFVSDFSC